MLYIYKIIKNINNMKTSIIEHLKFAFVVVSLMSAWCAAIIWLATLGN